jgi:uncharacterized membrane protein YgcG
MPMQLDVEDPMRHLLKHGLTSVALCCSLAFAAGACAQGAPPPSEQEQQLVAPIALYPDSLVAQILAASTNPVEIVEAWRWMQQHSVLHGQQLADAVDPQPWDPSVKALTQFPSVLENMNANLSWTSALGEAYASGSQDVLDAVQALRRQAQAAGSLPSTDQQTVSTQDQTIVIEPADPQVVYLPAYDPWLVYGAPMAAYPGWVGVPGVFYDGSDLYFGAGIGLFAGVAWGMNDWGFDWHDRRMMYHHAPYGFHGRPFGDRHGFDRGDWHGDHRAGHVDHGGEHIDHVPAFHDAGHERMPAFHAQAGARFQPAPHVGAFGGFDHGGVAGGAADRGRASFGGGPRAGGSSGGGFHGGGEAAGGASHGGGGFAAGGAHGGGAHR